LLGITVEPLRELHVEAGPEPPCELQEFAVLESDARPIELLTGQALGYSVMVDITTGDAPHTGRANWARRTINILLKAAVETDWGRKETIGPIHAAMQTRRPTVLDV